MKAMVREALEVGAIGFSTSNSRAHHDPKGNPVPSRVIRFEELVEFCSILAEVDRGTFHTTWGDHMTPEGISRLIELTGVPVTDTVINIKADGSHLTQIEAVESVWANGGIWFPQLPALDNTFEVGLEDPFMFGIDIPSRWPDSKPIAHALFGPIAELETTAERLEAYQSPEFRERFLALCDHPDWTGKYFPWMVINYSPLDPAIEGRPLLDVARDSGKKPGDVILDLSIESNLEARFGAVSGHQDPDKTLVLPLLEKSVLRFGSSDAGAHVSQLCDARYPTYVLGFYVRQKGLPIERAIQMMTTMEADVLGIHDRGSLTEGLAADIVVFDPETVNAGPLQRVNDQPNNARRLIADSVGIDHVIVNGTILRSHGKDTVDPDGDLPGKLLRSFAPISERRQKLQYINDHIRARRATA